MVYFSDSTERILSSRMVFLNRIHQKAKVIGKKVLLSVTAGETTEIDIEVNHLHINTTPIKQDINVILPLTRMAELEKEGAIGRLAPTAYSYYGFQWECINFLTEAFEPISMKMKLEGVEAVFLTPA